MAMKVLAVSSSPRRDGNSRLLAQSVLEGAQEAGHETAMVDLDEVLGGFLRDCRTCRGDDGQCTIPDRYGEVLLEQVLPADVLVLATPLYWYGVSASLKAFIDRFFCFIASDYPRGEEVRERLVGKRSVLVLSSEEDYRGAALGVIAQVQEMSRYLHHEFVGVVHGIGNARGEVIRDPADPLGRARLLGTRLGELRATDHRVDTVRPRVVWGGEAPLAASAHDA
jgi:multimeric flavodoxin WrbA